MSEEKKQVADEQLQKALNITSNGTGAEFAPDELSEEVFSILRQEMMLMDNFRLYTMKRNTRVVPVGKAGAVAYLVPEQAVDDIASRTAVTASTPVSASVTLTAKKMKVRVALTEEFEEDEVSDSLQFIKQDVADAENDGFEQAIINGDTTATHMDADVTSSSDVRKAFKGLRKYALAANLKVDLGTFNIANVRAIKTKMGRWGVKKQGDLMWIAGNGVYNKLLSLDEVTTVDKYGANATIVTGEIAKLDGIPVVVSPAMREDLNAAGVYDGTTTNKGTLLLVNKTGFLLGIKKQMAFAKFVDPRYGVNDLVATMRGDFQPVVTPGTGYEFVAIGYNIALS